LHLQTTGDIDQFLYWLVSTDIIGDEIIY